MSLIRTVRYLSDRVTSHGILGLLPQPPQLCVQLLITLVIPAGQGSTSIISIPYPPSNTTIGVMSLASSCWKNCRTYLGPGILEQGRVHKNETMVLGHTSLPLLLFSNF